MVKRITKITIALSIGGLFLWLAFRNVRLKEVWSYAKHMNFGWLVPFALAAFCSHIFRGLRWGLLIEHEKKDVDRVTLVSGVLVGYLMNIVGPRFGEVARPMYVAKREDLKTSKLIGTIVLERIVDVMVMIILMAFVSVYVIADLSVLEQIFGAETIRFLTDQSNFVAYVWSLFFLALAISAVYLFYKFADWLATKSKVIKRWMIKANKVLVMFKDGVLSAKEVEDWWLFLGYTVMIWLCYTLMTYIPFWMFNMQEVYHLDLLDALVITVVSAIGIAIPSPGGIGTYHYFVKQTLLVLFAVPAVTGIAYATITHASMVVFVACITPIVLFVDKLRSTKAGKAIM